MFIRRVDVERDADEEEGIDMGIAILSNPNNHKISTTHILSTNNNSMSQDFIFSSFPNGFERSSGERRDKLLVGLEEDQSGMLSEMFNFPAAAELQRRAAGEWYGNRSGGMAAGVSVDSKNHDASNSIAQAHPIAGINADAAMQLFLMNPQRARTASPPQPQTTSSTLHMLLPNQGFAAHPPLDHHHVISPWMENPSQGQGQGQGHGLSLSLSSSLQAKVDDFRMADLYYNQPVGAPAESSSSYSKTLAGMGQHVGFGSSIGAVNVLRSSKYVKAAQQLLEEFCSVGRGHFKKNRISRNSNPTTAASSSSSPVLSLSAADRIEHQRRKVKLLSMLDEVDRRYNHYCEQMQMVVNSFDLVMGFGAAVPYTALAQKAMSRHFRCLKDAVAAQLKQSCEVLGEKEGGGAGVTKGETPRLKLLEQSLRQQRAFHQMGMMDQEAWRPQRGLPERSVNILRAWLFEHFLHPYPSDADKHLLARQTGLSRNQVSNWFINARVRLWKPMVEDMYQQEAKEEDDADPQPIRDQGPETPTTTTVPDSDPSLVVAMNTRQSCFSENQAFDQVVQGRVTQTFPAVQGRVTLAPDGTSSATPPLRIGTTAAGDVSLTLGLRHAGNVLPPSEDPAAFSVRDFGG